VNRSSLRRRSDRPNRKVHPVRPAWETSQPTIAVEDDGLRGSDVYRTLRLHVRERAGNQCQADFDPDCHQTGTDPHHIYPTSEGGPVVCPSEWMLWVCRPCHVRIHDVETRPTAEILKMIVPRDRKPLML